MELRSPLSSGLFVSQRLCAFRGTRFSSATTPSDVSVSGLILRSLSWRSGQTRFDLMERKRHGSVPRTSRGRSLGRGRASGQWKAQTKKSPPDGGLSHELVRCEAISLPEPSSFDRGGGRRPADTRSCSDERSRGRRHRTGGRRSRSRRSPGRQSAICRSARSASGW